LQIVGAHYHQSAAESLERIASSYRRFADHEARGRSLLYEELAREVAGEQSKTLDLPQDGRLLAIAQSIESAMRAGATADVRRACAEFLRAASEFYKVSECGIRVLAARPLRVLSRSLQETDCPGWEIVLDGEMML
jgi:hypothetical protein